MALPPPTTEMLVVFAVVLAAVVLFVTEVVSPDTTAISVIVTLVVLGPWTGITPSAALSGFSSSATITILSMYILSAGVQDTGAVRRLGARVAAFTHGSQSRLLGTTVGLTGVLAGFINNTPVVAMFIPMVTDLADRSHLSPSKLLIPLSYASMLGGVLTLIGTATNILASDVVASLAPQYPDAGLHAFSMFEFTPLGVVVLLVGLAYLMTIGQHLIPERIHPSDLTGEFGLDDHLRRVYVRQNSPMVGLSVGEAMAQYDVDVDVIQLISEGRTFIAPSTDRVMRPRDILTVRGTEAAVLELVELGSLGRLPQAQVTEDELADPEGRGTLVEVVITGDSSVVGNTITEVTFRERFSATVLGVRRGSTLFRDDLSEVVLAEGDGLLLHTTPTMAEHMEESNDFSVTETVGQPEPDEFPPLFETQAPLAVGIVAGVIALAALDLLPIVIAALAGVAAMIVTGVLDPTDAYDAVSWDIIFLLAGVLPLGLALQNSGGAEYLAGLIVANGGLLPAIVILGLFYLLTGLLANVITPVASVVLMIPIAVDAASRIGAEPFSFVLAVTFAASTAFMTPIGYQTNLMVYSPGGYRFTDYIRVGAPLQLLLTVVTPLAISVIWSV